jgi:molecular chaperone IbpA
MSNLTLTTSRMSPELARFMIGFDHLFDTINAAETWANASPSRGSYPPYNVLRRDDDHYALEIAVAGFGEKDLSVTVNNGKLTVVGDIQQDEDASVTYVHRGLARRKFQQEWTLVEYVNVTDVTVQNGIMTIELERQLPDSLKPRSVAINFVR